jgi:hypothetical protein
MLEAEKERKVGHNDVKEEKAIVCPALRISNGCAVLAVRC